MTASQIKQWLPAVIWASLILMASSDMFSAAHTRTYIEAFFRWLFPSWTPYSIYKAHLVVRKCAHFFEYAVLAIFVMRGFGGNADPSTRSTMSRSVGMTSETKPGASSSGMGSVGMTFLRVVVVCAMVATIDEVHQHFVPSRTSSPYDVLLDTTGSTAAMLLLTWRASSRRAEQRTA
jgi:VanZ family protein